MRSRPKPIFPGMCVAGLLATKARARRLGALLPDDRRQADCCVPLCTNRALQELPRDHSTAEDSIALQEG